MEQEQGFLQLIPGKNHALKCSEVDNCRMEFGCQKFINDGKGRCRIEYGDCGRDECGPCLGKSRKCRRGDLVKECIQLRWIREFFQQTTKTPTAAVATAMAIANHKAKLKRRREDKGIVVLSSGAAATTTPKLNHTKAKETKGQFTVGYAHDPGGRALTGYLEKSNNTYECQTDNADMTNYDPGGDIQNVTRQCYNLGGGVPLVLPDHPNITSYDPGGSIGNKTKNTYVNDFRVESPCYDPGGDTLDEIDYYILAPRKSTDTNYDPGGKISGGTIARLGYGPGDTLKGLFGRQSYRVPFI